MPTCFHHRDRETGRSCTRCDRPACSECLHDAPVGSHCWQCIRDARPPAAVRLRRWNATSGPLVTKAIIGANLIVFALTALTGGAARLGGSLQYRLALFGPAVASGEWYRIVSSGFVHYGVLHIAFNMIVLYQFGGMLEPALGRIRYLALYFVALVSGSFGALLLNPSAFTAGASGAVFGLVGAAAVGLRQRGISIWRTGIGGLVVINLVLTFAIPGISIGGHLGGLGAGAVMGAVMLRSPISRRATVEGLALAAAMVVLLGAGALWAASAASPR